MSNLFNTDIRLNSYQIALEEDDAQSFGSEVVDFASYGITSSIVSGVTGLINTGIAFTNVFGAELEKFNTEDTLDNWGWENTAEYYKDHKTTIDAIGFGLSALVPGSIGLKAANIVQKGLAVSQTNSRFVLGLRTALVPEKQAAKLKKLIQNDSFALEGRNKLVAKAAKEGFHQAAVDSVFAETAIILATNQNPTINSEDLSYFDSITNNLGGLAFGVAFGTGIGGVINTALTYGTLRHVANDQLLKENKTWNFGQVDSANVRSNINQGDRISDLVDKRNNIQEGLNNAKEGTFEINAATMKEGQRRLNQMDAEIQLEIARLTEEAKGGDIVKGKLSGALWNVTRNMNTEDAVNFYAGANRIGTFEDIDVLFNPKATTLKAIDDDEWLPALQKARFGDDFIEGSAEQLKAVQSSDNSLGTTFINKDIGQPDVLIKNSILKGKDKEKALAVLRHEMGHANTDRLTEILDFSEMKAIKDQLTNLSRMNRPQHWAGVDAIPAMQEKLLKRMSENATIDELTELGTQIQQLENMQRYINRPDELLADSWAIFNNPEQFKRAIADGPDVYRLMSQNSAVKQRVGRSEVLIDLKNGNMFDVVDRVPTVADRGNVSFNKITKNVTFTEGAVNTRAKFNVLTATPDEASAYYYAQTQLGRLAKNVETDWTDFATFNRILFLQRTKGYQGIIKIKIDDNTTRVMTLTDDVASVNLFKQLYKDLKTRALQEIRNSKNPKSFSTSDLARITDTGEDFAEASGFTGGTAFWSDIYDPTQPTVAKVFYKNRVDVADPLKSQAISDVQLRIRNTQEKTTNAINSLLHTVDQTLVDIFPKAAHESGVNYAKYTTRATINAGFIRAAQGDYGESTSFIAQVAKANEKFKSDGINKINTELSGSALAVKNDPAALAEAAVLDSKLRQKFFNFAPRIATTQDLAQNLADRIKITEVTKANSNIERIMASPAMQAIIPKANENVLWSRELESLLDSLVNTKRFSDARLSKLLDMAETDITTIKSNKLANFWRAKVSANQQIVQGKRTIASVRGLETNINDEVLYPGILDTNRYKFMKFVFPNKNKNLWSENRPGIIGGPSPEALAAKEAQLIDQFGDDLLIIGKDQVAQFKKTKGEYDSKFDITEFNVDRTMQRKGVQWDVAPEPTPQVIDHYLNDMHREWRSIADNLTEARYGEEFAVLQAQSDLVNVQRATFGPNRIKGDPFQEQARIMLNRKNEESFNNWRTAQEQIDRTVSKVFNTTRSMFSAAKTTGDYEQMTEFMKQHNMPLAYNDQIGDFLVQTEGVNEQLLASVIPRANAVAATMMLRLDYIQPFMNAISTPITSVPEIRHLLDSLPKLRAQQARSGLQVTIPDGSGQSMPTNTRLLYQAVKDFFGDKELVKRYHELGLTPSIVKEMRDVAEIIALDPTALKQGGMAKFNAGFKVVIDTLAKPADWTEEFVKFTAVRMADLVLTAGGITDDGIKHMAMRTYMNRVHGNYTFAQRPALFQGFGGQAIGLFQTYQFNLFQQLLRHVGDGKVKSAASMMGIQAGLFGAQSVPGFRVLNEHIGERSVEGNDFYTGTADVLGTEVSEWLLYGASSNFTKPIFGSGLELYTRGDLNPRTPFIIPTSIDEIPIYSLATKFISSIMTSANAIANDIPVGQAFAEALATNGVNRPLAGIGQILAGGRTTSKGTLLASVQDLDWWSGVTRILGAKPLDESIAIQSYYRAKGYDSYRREQLNILGRNVKKMVRSGEEFSPEVMTDFARKYTINGGKIDYYNRWLHDQALGATESAIYGMYSVNDSPSGRYLQRIMGGNIENYIDVTYE